MEFLLIGESKIKIVINSEEVERYRLDLEVNTPLARRALWRILDIARSEVGFDTGGDKVLIQVYPTKDGGGEIFVTKLGLLPESSARLVSRSDKVSLLSRKNSVYSFLSIDDLISASRAVKGISSVSLQSDVYYDGSRYYLTVEEYGRGGEPLEFPCILEFGSLLSSELFAYVSEHADRLTSGDGIDKFSRL